MNIDKNKTFGRRFVYSYEHLFSRNYFTEEAIDGFMGSTLPMLVSMVQFWLRRADTKGLKKYCLNAMISSSEKELINVYSVAFVCASIDNYLVHLLNMDNPLEVKDERENILKKIDVSLLFKKVMGSVKNINSFNQYAPSLLRNLNKLEEELSVPLQELQELGD